ncbi:flagellar basal body-associated protein FliL, partial [Pseudomonas syringae pv. tagetis]
MALEVAKEEGGGRKAAYVSVKPPFVGNYAVVGGHKLRVYLADIALRVRGADAEAGVKRNEALIRNLLVSLFTQQSV